ncbi:hypothetical protein [Actinomadura gamaensis]|uniref:Uncharacterized protein n=1 Tax=Actinomadura gamaensis TaxID=1763541 RepID=A0ABV9U2R9_9ACTN
MNERRDEHDAAALRRELHALVDELADERLPAALLRLHVEAVRPVSTVDEALAGLAALPGGLPAGEVARARSALSAHRRAS